MPKGSVPRNGPRLEQRISNAKKLATAKAQREAKSVNTWNEYRAAGTDTAGHATKALRKSMKDVRSVASTGGALARIKENPVSALKRRAATKKK